MLPLVLEGRRIAPGASRGRKVRTPLGAMPHNPSPYDWDTYGRFAVRWTDGKCHRKQTARRHSSEWWQVMVKRCGKSAPREAQATRHGKPHRVQDQIGNPGAARSGAAKAAGFRVLVAKTNDSLRRKAQTEIGLQLFQNQFPPRTPCVAIPGRGNLGLDSARFISIGGKALTRIPLIPANFLTTEPMIGGRQPKLGLPRDTDLKSEDRNPKSERNPKSALFGLAGLVFCKPLEKLQMDLDEIRNPNGGAPSSAIPHPPRAAILRPTSAFSFQPCPQSSILAQEMGLKGVT